jgi:hypothetical protein
MNRREFITGVSSAVAVPRPIVRSWGEPDTPDGGNDKNDPKADIGQHLMLQQRSGIQPLSSTRLNRYDGLS